MEETTLYVLEFNNAYKVVKTEEKGILLKRGFVEEDGVTYCYFDPKNDFKKMDPSSVRYITNGVKEKIREEIINNDKSLYAAMFDETPIEGEQKEVEEVEPVNNQDLKLVTDGITEMQKTMIAGFNAMITKNPYEDAIVDAVIEKGKKIATVDLENTLKANVDKYISENYGALPKTIQIVEGDVQKKPITGIFHEQFDNILKIVSRDVPLMLVGPAGSGKNHTLEQVAEALEMDFYFTNAITQEYTLKGFIDANGTFHETEFYKAFTKGGLFFLDEMDASIPEALIILNAAIANRYFDFPNGRVNAHEDFRVVSAANTVGTGASSEYVGRSQLDAATLDRFVQITFNYDAQVESKLAVTDELYRFIIGLRKAIKSADIRYIVSMRATINASKLDDLLSPSEIVNNVILKGMENDDRRLLVREVEGDNKYTRALRGLVEGSVGEAFGGTF